MRKLLISENTAAKVISNIESAETQDRQEYWLSFRKRMLAEFVQISDERPLTAAEHAEYKELRTWKMTKPLISSS